jgi:hypothetical protein
MKRLGSLCVLILCFVAMGAGLPAFAASDTDLPTGVWAVDNNPAKPTFGTPGAQDGLTWEKAYNNIQDGIDAAFAAGGGQVWVADGTYGEGRGQSWGAPSVTGSLVLKTGVEVYGGFRGYEANDLIGNEQELIHRSVTQGVSVIDGSTSRGGSPAFHVVVVGGESASTDAVVLDGFHITGGLASSAAADSYHRNRGAGIFVYGSDPLIRNCTVYNNTADTAGGGIALAFNPTSNTPANAEITNCVFYNNRARRIIDTDSPPAAIGGGVVGGGAIFIDGGSPAPGADPSIPVIQFCTFNSNVVETPAANNSIWGVGSTGIFSYVDGSAGGVNTPIVTHSIFWPNTANTIKSESTVGYTGGASVTYSIVNAGYSCPAFGVPADPSPGFVGSGCGTGNLTSDPVFTGAPPAFPITGGSPAQNIGILTDPATDIQGLTRVSPDIGAYEGDGALVGPTASIDETALDPRTNYVPESYTLNNTGPGATTGSLPVRIVWDIEDDGIENYDEIAPSHNYTVAGTYTARLILSNGIGVSEDTVEFNFANPMAVNAPAPANPTRNNYDAISFSVSVPASPVRGFPPYSYQWQFSTDGVTYGTTLRDGSTLADGSYTSVRPGRNPAINPPGIDPNAYLVDVPWSVSGVTSPTLAFDHVVRGVHNGFYRCRVSDSQYGTLVIAEGRVDSAGTQLTITDKLIILDPPTSLELYEGNLSSIPVTVFGGVSPATNYTYTWDLFDPVSGNTDGILNSNVDPYEFVADANPPVATVGGWVSGTGSAGFYSFLASDFTITPAENSGARVENLPVDVQPAVDVEITTQPADLTRNVTQTLTLTTTIAGGYPGYTYVWTFNGAELEDGQPHPSGSAASVSGATTGTLIVAGLEVPDAGDYAVQVVDSKGDSNNLPAPCPLENGLCSDIEQVTVQVTNNLIVTSQPDSLTVYAGDDVTFTVSGGGGQLPYTFDWFWETEDGFGPFSIPFVGSHPASQTGSAVAINSAGTTSTLTVTNVGVGVPTPGIPRGDEGVYYVTVNDGVLINQPDTSEDAVLEVFPPVAVTTNPVSQSVYAGADVTFSVQATGGINDSRNFQWQVDTGSGFGDIGGETSSTLTLSSVVLADDGNLYRCIVTAPDSDVVTPLANYEQASAAATLTVSEALVILGDPADVVTYTTEAPFILKSEFQGGLPFGSAPIYQTDWRREGLSPASPEISVGAGDLIVASPNTTQLTVDPGLVGAGVFNYRVNITDQVQTTSSDTARVEIAALPSFSQPLVNSTAREGDDFTWTVVVSGGVQPLDYQWERDVDGAKAFAPIAGSGPSITLTNVQIADEGVYQVTVTDAAFADPIQSQATLTIGDALPMTGGLGLAALAALSALGGAMAIRRRRH